MYNSFHIDHAASLTYIMEKASLPVVAAEYPSIPSHRQILRMERAKFT